jgi:hypothetical protein
MADFFVPGLASPACWFPVPEVLFDPAPPAWLAPVFCGPAALV